MCLIISSNLRFVSQYFKLSHHYMRLASEIKAESVHYRPLPLDSWLIFVKVIVAAPFWKMQRPQGIYMNKYSNTFYSFTIFSLLINAVILLLNCLVLILYFYIYFLSLRCYFLYLNIIPIFVLFHCFYSSWCWKLFHQAVGYGHLWCYF